MKLDYVHNTANYDHLIGAVVRGNNMQVLGKIVSIEYAYDRWQHHNAVAVLDNGRRISCRTFSKVK